MAAVAKSIEKTAHLVMCHPLHIHTHHGVSAFLMSKEFTFSVARKTKIQRTCTQPHITFVSGTRNMADNMMTGTPHSCEEKAIKDSKLRDDLCNEPLTNPEMWLYTDGCCYKGDDGLVAAYAVVQQHQDGRHEKIDSGLLAQPASAQLAEVKALIQALKAAEGRTVNIFTDSAYAHGAVHVDAVMWKRRGYTTSNDTPIKHTKAIQELVNAVQLPTKVAIMKCKGHDTQKSRISAGNDAADKAAKETGGYLPKQMVLAPAETLIQPLQVEDIKEMQKKAGPYEWSEWTRKGGAKDKEGLWRAHDGRMVAPAKLLQLMLPEAHGLTHEGKKKKNNGKYLRPMVASTHGKHSTVVL